MSTIATLGRAARLPFLMLTLSSVFLGAASAWATQGQLDPLLLCLVLLGALGAHVSVNTLNEYADFRSGLDETTTRTPFSGGSGALIEHPRMSGAVLRLSILSLLLTCLVGLYFVYLRGPALLPLGILGLMIVLSYTPWLNRHPWLCLLAPGLAFGPLMVGGTHFVLTGETELLPWLVSLVPGLLASNLLLLNQFPDIEADQSVGRHHFPIAYGIVASTRVYGLSLLAALALIGLAVMQGHLPGLSLIAAIPLLGGLLAYLGASRFGSAIGGHVHYLALNVAAALLTPLLLGISLVIG